MRSLGVGLLLAIAGAAPALAQGPSGPTAAPPDPGAPPAAARDPLAVEGAVRVLSAYVSRGFVQEDDGVVVQPEGQVVYTFLDRPRWSLGALAGAFASIHSEATGVGDASRAVDHWFELAGWLGLSLDAGGLSIRPYYEWSDSPSGASGLAQEVAVLVAWDDTGWSEWLSLQPRLLLARETEGAGDDGENGTYLGLGLEPTFVVPAAALGELRLWLPLELGLSLSDFYEDAEGRDEPFGYGSAGAFAAAPLPFLPGAATLELGARRTWFGDHAREANGDRGTWIGSAGLTVGF